MTDGQAFWISFGEKLQYLLIFCYSLKDHMIKTLIVFKRFHLESFVWMRQVEIFILIFSEHRFYSHACATRCILGQYKELSLPDYVKNHAYWCTLTFTIDFWHFWGHRIQTSHCFDVLKYYFRIGLVHTAIQKWKYVRRLKFRPVCAEAE
jgi:hypothetical protein